MPDRSGDTRSYSQEIRFRDFEFERKIFPHALLHLYEIPFYCYVFASKPCYARLRRTWLSGCNVIADLFVDSASGDLSGPMVPYREMETRHRGKMQLLPHAAADTEHVSRVEGARTVNGVGKVTGQDLASIAANDALLDEMREHAENMAAFWGAVAATEDPVRRQQLIDDHGASLVNSSNCYSSNMEASGAKGPFV